MKHTKKALLASVLSMLLCVSMLVGSTFAWFTDSVTSGKNQIVAGTLDVELQYSTDGEKWIDVDEKTNVFKKDALWEPGYTEVVYLKVKNAGTLALKYQFDVTVAGKVIGKTAEGEDIDLSEFLRYGVATDVTDTYKNRTEAREAIKSTDIGLSEGYIGSDNVLNKGEESSMIALVVYMPETVDNAANHGTDMDVPEISLGLSVLATQATVEKDSFDDQYDKDAVYPVLVVNNAGGMADALDKIQDGGVVELAGDVEMEGTGDPLYVAGKDITIDLNGHTLSSPSLDESLVVDGGANVTVTGGDIVFTQSHSSDFGGKDGDIPYIVVYNDEDGTEETTSLTLENCTVKFESLSSAGNEPLNGISVAAEEGKKAELNIGENALIDCKMGSGAAVILGANATVNMTDGKIIANNCEEKGGVTVYGVYLGDDSAEFNMEGGVINVTGVSAVSGIYFNNCGTANMSGGEINVDAYSATLSQYAIGIEFYGSGTFNMTDGTINVKKTDAGNKMISEAIDAGSRAEITVNGSAKINIDQTVKDNDTSLGFTVEQHAGVEEGHINYITSEEP